MTAFGADLIPATQGVGEVLDADLSRALPTPVLVGFEIYRVYQIARLGFSAGAALRASVSLSAVIGKF